jgi:hypothetical protein
MSNEIRFVLTVSALGSEVVKTYEKLERYLELIENEEYLEHEMIILEKNMAARYRVRRIPHDAKKHFPEQEETAQYQDEDEEDENGGDDGDEEGNHSNNSQQANNAGGGGHLLSQPVIG